MVHHVVKYFPDENIIQHIQGNFGGTNFVDPELIFKFHINIETGGNIKGVW